MMVNVKKKLYSKYYEVVRKIEFKILYPAIISDAWYEENKNKCSSKYLQWSIRLDFCREKY